MSGVSKASARIGLLPRNRCKMHLAYRGVCIPTSGVAEAAVLPPLVCSSGHPVRNGKSRGQLLHCNLSFGFARRRPQSDVASPRHPLTDQHVSITGVFERIFCQGRYIRVAAGCALRSLCPLRVAGKSGQDVAAPGSLAARIRATVPRGQESRDIAIKRHFRSNSPHLALKSPIEARRTLESRQEANRPRAGRAARVLRVWQDQQSARSFPTAARWTVP